MAQQTINLGTTPSDGTGDALRVALDKCNDNFSELYASVAAVVSDAELTAAVAALNATISGSDAALAAMIAEKLDASDPSVTNARTPTGGAGGVLSGTYPNPGFAVDMATQAELNAAIPATASQAEMEAGTETALRLMSPLRVKQAIAALAAGGGAWGDLTGDPTDSAAMQAVIDTIYTDTFGYAEPKNPTQTSYTVTANTLIYADKNNLLLLTPSGGGSVTLTVPPNAAIAFNVGTKVWLRQVAAGTITIVAGSGVTINSLGGVLTMPGTWGYAVLTKTATNTWTYDIVTTAAGLPTTGGTLTGNLVINSASGRQLDVQASGVSHLWTDPATLDGGWVRSYLSAPSSLSFVPYNTGGATSMFSLFKNAVGSLSTAFFDCHAYIWSGYQLMLANGRADAPDCGLKWGAAGVAKITNGSTGYGALDASGYRAGGNVGVSGTLTDVTTISLTVEGGIITSMSGS